MGEPSSAIVTTITGDIAILRFDRPAERNPLSASTLHDLDRLLSELTSNEEIKSIIFTGAAEVFASGANIRELARLDASSALLFSQLGQRIFQKIAEAPQLTIAAINGYCLGGALDLALACDIRIASANAVFAHPGARLGIITGWGGTQRLPKLIGRARALELFATARRVSSQEALCMGLITRVEDPVMESAMAYAQGTVADDEARRSTS